jgi:hypothetical protein
MKTRCVAFGAVLAACAALAGPAFAQNDSTVILYIHRDHIQVDTVRGHAPNDGNTTFDGRLPREPVDVVLGNWNGRGYVRLIQQPTADNDYTAAIRIRDPQPGSGFYTVTVNW